jgi:hypothetical protein
MYGSANRLAALILAAVAGAFLLTTTGAAQPSRTATKMQIAIHEIWRGPNTHDSIKAKFRIESRNAGVPLATLGSGTAIIYPKISPPKYNVFGQETWTFSGSQALTSKNGTLQFSFSGNTVFVNNKLSSSGQVLTWEDERGTWKITDGTGVYQGWKGGGRFASVDPPFEDNSEFDGIVTH